MVSIDLDYQLRIEKYDKYGRFESNTDLRTNSFEDNLGFMERVMQLNM